ncbi:MAG: ATPase [Lachnospiraceae bacterium]|nr:ATPase [Lachnospiraceae bacterium]
MNNLVIITLAAALTLSFVIPWAVFMKGERSKRRYKSSLAVNLVSFFGLLLIATVLLFTAGTPAMAETAEAGAGFSTAFAYIAAALVTGMSTIGGGIAVASAASAALGALSEDSTVFGKSLVFVGLSEGVCLYGLIISFMILGKV